MSTRTITVAHPGRGQATGSGSGSRARAPRASAAGRPATSTSSSHVTPHPVFGRKGDNLTLTVPVTFAEAALGAEIKVPTLTAAPVTLQDPGGHRERPHLPGARQGRRRARTAPRATCW